MKERTPKHTAAVSTLERLGYTYCGGEQWKPPLGQAPDFGLVNAQRARIAELEAELEAVGAGGVQALSAAPEAKKSALRTYPNPIVPLIKPVSEQEKMRALYLASSNLMAYLGRNGAIHSDGHAADVLMNCLNDLDGGEFDETLFAASPTPPAEQQASATEVALVGAYARLPDFDSGDEPIWEAVFKWKAANPGSDASKKAMAVEGAIIKSLRDFADRTHALRMQAAPKAAPAKVKLKGEAFGSARVGDIFYTALQQDEPVGEVVSASCDHATVRWLHQTSSVGGGDPRNSRAWPKVSGVSRDEGHSRALLVFFAAEPTDDEVRAVHDTLAAAPTAKAAPQQEAQEPVAWLNPWRADKVTTDYDAYGERGIPLYTAPQPAPAPLSESIDQVERALAIICVVGAIDGYDVVRRESVLEIARRRAALAAQGGKDAG